MLLSLNCLEEREQKKICVELTCTTTDTLLKLAKALEKKVSDIFFEDNV